MRSAAPQSFQIGRGFDDRVMIRASRRRSALKSIRAADGLIESRFTVK